MPCYLPGITRTKINVLPGKGDHVVLLDGIAHDGLNMKGFAKALNQQGYQVLNLGYPSTQLSISEIAEDYLTRHFAKHLPEDGRPVHFITHSMGGIVLRHYHHTFGMGRLGRVVMLSPPNHGSEVAEHLKHFFVYQWYFGPAGQEIGTGRDSVPLGLPAADFEVGVLTGSVSFDPWFDPLFEGTHDGKVSVESARLEGMKEFRVVPCSHYGMTFSRKVQAMAMRFLAEGGF
ncbi:esterase/lipase family protein [Rubellicoccus peritrichatus]|uniref:Alpha/beta fold hydrolase n=1 Tax=Rubellicoccus peritrichatus TaxID=3080537 RepID=A0AAQ3LAT6_9BACT|nr:alpha/beta fold hydrolase [Puniceicoccus sp. CR14]WOO41847.1 alpha/beta fold hydrolase [Puniceicoccus sp. CR14]